MKGGAGGLKKVADIPCGPPLGGLNQNCWSRGEDIFFLTETVLTNAAN